MDQSKSVLESQKRIGPVDIRLTRDQRGRLVLQLDSREEPLEDVRVARCFPWSLRDRYLSIRDSEGNEVVLLTSLDHIAGETRTIIEQELRDQELIPRITAVESVDDSFDVMSWKVLTDCGSIELQIKTTDDIHLLDDRRVVLKDHAGGQFEIPDLGMLDGRSQRLVEDHLG